jgi:hypothetical protein
MRIGLAQEEPIQGHIDRYRGELYSPKQPAVLRSPGTILILMARGWESKSVEAQQAEAWEKSNPARRRLSPEEAARVREKESLRLARQRLLQQIERTENPRHRKLLEDSLAELEKRMSAVGNNDYPRV